MIYEKIKFTNSKPINEIDPGYLYKIKQLIYAGHVFKCMIPIEYSPNGNLLSAMFCFEDIDEDKPARKVLEVANKNVDLAEKKSGKTFLNDYEKIIDLYVSEGRELSACIPRAFGPDGRVVSVTLIFLKYVE